MLLDPSSGCASPLSIDGVAFGVGTWSTSGISTVQVGQTVLDRYTMGVRKRIFPRFQASEVRTSAFGRIVR